ncbi:tRNA (guanosine(37)-N1)-methyltransferase TrmD [Varunaivibrio sulfuroxidans]|uniref:tRNA (guanine-N(1)-)-methyltransferase n=1 Tax=Varunaivibrio sulfuroxidans TaxID=1773489 RepID=A0A4V2UP37_9PROT|nr:tRNA (guanosine(37)-N1)-methyltransferase TrmD [Varunaivibrio sulfuroxidans]TCS63621.1 tRNA (guanine37-N(1)-) methyltransferase [Varunaivibrio sulfuroxidans]WES30238.1 tRNA (guanosine(37)-N1)-methyltransferase TrmD [Varunaivibrio sulfuroxidans]
MGDVVRRPWSARLLTLYPEMFPGPLGQSLAGRALEDGRWSLETVNIRSFATDKHHTVDDTPSGGGAGMVMRPDVIDRALTGVMADGAVTATDGAPLIYLTPRGRPLTQDRVKALAEGPGVVVLCGRFEGVDQRVLDARAAEEISVGDFVLSGGEIAALVLLDACVRLLPGVIGSRQSLDEESFERDLLEYPHYTRPRSWAGRDVPEVLLSGHHEKICAWRQAQSEIVTRERRPDLWARYLKNRVSK